MTPSAPTNQSENLKQATARGFVWAALGGGTQQVVMLLIGIAMARMLSESDYGMVGMLTVFSLLAGNIQESGFTATLAVRREATHEDYSAVFWFSSTVGLLLYMLLFLAAPLIAAYNHTPALTLYARVIFLGFVMTAIAQASSAQLFRQLRVRERTSAQVTASIVSGVAGVVVAIVRRDCWALVAMDLCYKFTYALLAIYMAHWRPMLMAPRAVWSHIRPLLPQSVNVLATNVLNTLSTQVVQALLGHRYVASLVGHYAQAQKWQTLGQQFISGMVGSVAQPVLGRVNNDANRQERVLLTMLRFTAFVSFPVLLGLAYVAPEVIPMLIGDKWLPCVPLLQMFCIAGSTIPLSQTLSNLIIARQRSGVYLAVSSLMLSLQLMAFYLFAGQGLQMLVFVVASLNLLAFPVWALTVRTLCGIHLRGMARSVLPYAGAMACGVLISNWLGCTHFWTRIPAVAVVYVGLLMAFRNATLREAWQFISRR